MVKSQNVLETCLQANPASKLAHLEIGRVLITVGDNKAAIEHLRRSFTEGDNHYEAQFWYARELFLQGHFDEANKRFKALDNRAPGRFRRAAATIESSANSVQCDCRIERKEDGYAFLKVPQFPQDIFASRAESEPTEWSKLYYGAEARCGLAFNRRGPRAVSVRLAG